MKVMFSRERERESYSNNIPQLCKVELLMERNPPPKHARSIIAVHASNTSMAIILLYFSR